ncbi:MAG: hypothetical protein C0613_03245 [Desulfobulbaceae bacterium]|nr:MAG: hypothetical protein C0613_03245 [Desulfobulbaceae bacterium]
MKQETQEKKITAKLIDGTVIRGVVNLNSDTAPMDRVSDLMIKGTNPFIVIYGTTVGVKKNQVFIVNKHHIVWASPVEEEGDYQP